MTVTAPPRPPQPPHDEPEALIEEARRRARRRRVMVAAVAVAAAVIGGGSYAAVELIGGGSATGGAGGSRGSGGQVAGRIRHVLVTFGGPSERARVYRVDLGSRRILPLRATQETWFDPVTHLYRVTLRLGNKVSYDQVGSSCLRFTRDPALCPSPSPFFDAEQYRQSFKNGALRKTGEALLRGRRVIWLQGKYDEVDPRLAPAYARVALDKGTLRPVVAQNFIRGRLSDEREYTFFRNLPAGTIDFSVPEGGAPRGAFPPIVPHHDEFDGSGPAAARDTLGRPPLWLGRRFLGYSLESIKSGVKRVQGFPDLSARVVHIVYTSPASTMSITLDEYTPDGAALIGPKVGVVVVPPEGEAYVDGFAMLLRNGVVVSLGSGLDRPDLLRALARLRPVPTD